MLLNSCHNLISFVKLKGGGNLAKYIIKRIILLIPVVLAVVVLIFMILHLAPGDPTISILGDMASEEARAALRIKLGLDKPIIVQLGSYMAGLIRGDFGNSYTAGTPVFPELLNRYPNTIILASLSMLFAVVFGMAIGLVSAVKQYSIADGVLTTIMLVLVSMPTFWVGMLMVILFSLKLRWLPASGWYGPKYWIMPAIAVGIAQMAYVGRTTRSSMLEIIRSDYIRTARAKGQTEGNIIFHHELRNALIPIITVISNQLGGVLGGSMVTEQIFSIPGMGIFMLTAIKARDYTIVQGGVIFVAISFACVNLLADIIYAFVDPRVKQQYKNSGKKKLKAAPAAAEGGSKG